MADESPVPSESPPAQGPTPVARLRRLHALLAPFVLLPLAVTVASGMGYRLLRDWGGMGRDRAHVLMVLHEGEWLTPWLGRHAETVYVLLNGLGLVWMLVSGGAMAWQRLRREWGRSRGGGA